MKSFDVVLFDVDGTLIDSAPGILHTMKYTFDTMGADISGVDLRAYLGPPLRKTMERHFSETALVEKAVDVYRGYYRTAGAHMCTLYPGVSEMLQRLRSSKLLLCTATSKPVEVVEPMLNELGIASFFDVVGGAAMDRSRDTKTLVIQYLMRLPSLSGKRIIMIGDRKEDILAAKECGIPSIGVSYGYAAEGELEAAAPDYIVEDCNELADLLLQNKK